MMTRLLRYQLDYNVPCSGSLSEEKLDELQVNVTIHDVSIICVTETWFKYYMDDNNLSIEGEER